VDIVEGFTSSKTKKGIAHGVGAGIVGAPATRDSFVPTVRKKTLHDGDAPGLTHETSKENRSGRAPLRRQQ
jgi:hypothetical protein